MRERGENLLTAQERAGLADTWEALRRRIDPIIEGATAFLQVSEEEYRRLLDATERRLPATTIEELVRGLRLEPTAWRLGRARDVLLAMPAKGNTPILFRTNASANGPALTITAVVPQAAVQDLTAAIVSMAAQGGAF